MARQLELSIRILDRMHFRTPRQASLRALTFAS